MTTKSFQLQPPPHYGIKTLDKTLFTTKTQIWCLLLQDLRHLGIYLGNKKSSGIAMKIPSYPSIVEFPQTDLNNEEISLLKEKNPKLKALLINPDFTSNASSSNEEGQETEFQFNIDVVDDSLIKSLESHVHLIKRYEVTFDYDYWTHEQILKACLPIELHDNCPTSFTIAGHLAHLNLKDEYMPYKNLIGEIILSKYPNIKTVVNKTNNITSEFRTFEMEILAGADNFVVSQKESGCVFTFDFSKVYWNSRLATEHERLIKSFKENEAICDVMAGVGPFAVPAGKNNVLVLANDLNPESYKYLQLNIKNNKVSQYVEPYNFDGVNFIKDSPKLLWDYHQKNPKFHKVISSNRKKQNVSVDTPSFFSQYIMNLPDSAITFVPHYVSLFSRAFPHLTRDEVKALKGYKLPIINVHHFEKYKEEDIEGDIMTELHKRIRNKIAQYLDFDIDISAIKFHVVRQVAPCKPMFCISFELPEDVAFRPI